LSHLSDKELLEVLADFPKHELTTIQRTEMLKTISDAGARNPKRHFPVQRIGAIAAMFILLLISPILYLTNTVEEKKQNTGAVIKVAQEGVHFAIVDKDGTHHYADSNYGIPNKVSLLAPKEWVAYDDRGTSKIMVFLWGKDLDLDQTLNIDATHVETGIKEHLNNARLSGGLYGADAHAVTSFVSLNKTGKWNLEFTLYNYLGEKKKVGEFSIYVKAPYVMLGRGSTLMISQEDLFAGFYKEAFIEVAGENLPSEIELEVSSLENDEVSTFTFKDKSDYTTTEGRKISLYKGDFQIKKSGKYNFGVLGDSNFVRVWKPTDQ
jgi:hypothetical protein